MMLEVAFFAQAWLAGLWLKYSELVAWLHV